VLFKIEFSTNSPSTQSEGVGEGLAGHRLADTKHRTLPHAGQLVVCKILIEHSFLVLLRG